MTPRKSFPFFPLMACVFMFGLAGCGSGQSYEISEVQGQLFIKGQPGNKIRIEFVPDVDRGTSGPMSSAETDESGRFQMHIMSEDTSANKPGAVVGHHRVVLSDLQLAESATGAGIPIRLGNEYSLPGSTPLQQEVKSGPQTLELHVD